MFRKGVILRNVKSLQSVLRVEAITLQLFTIRQILAQSRLKAFADDKLSVAKTMISVFDRIENIVGNGENAGYQHFLLFPQCFQEAFYTNSLKVVIVW